MPATVQTPIKHIVVLMLGITLVAPDDAAGIQHARSAHALAQYVQDRFHTQPAGRRVAHNAARVRHYLEAAGVPESP
jgi:hypothetical protein